MIPDQPTPPHITEGLRTAAGRQAIAEWGGGQSLSNNILMVGSLVDVLIRRHGPEGMHPYTWALLHKVQEDLAHAAFKNSGFRTEAQELRQREIAEKFRLGE